MDTLTQAQSKEFDSLFGKFTCKIPSVKQRLQISQRIQMYGNGPVMSVIDWDLAEAFGLLDIVVTQAPSGWAKDEQTGGWKNYDDIYDTDALLALTKEVKEWIDSFRSGVRKEQGEVGA
jgi:hypothetical protein